MSDFIIVSTHPTDYIIVQCGDEEAAKELNNFLTNISPIVVKNAMDKFLVAREMVPDVHILPFIQESALFLRKFLTGRKFSMNNTAKQVLKYLADETVEPIFWDGKLSTLDTIKKPRDRKSALDYIYMFPFRYIDRSNPQKIDDLVLGGEATVIGKIVSIKNFFAASITTVVVADDFGKQVDCVFFNQMWLERAYKPGDNVIVTGKFATYKNKRTGQLSKQIASPKIDNLMTRRGNMKMIPVYSQRGGVGKTWDSMRKIETIFNKIPFIEDTIPQDILLKHDIISREDSLRKIHFPDNPEDIEKAKERIAYEELLQLQTFLHLRNNKWSKQKGTIKDKFSFADEMINSLPYSLTGAQNRAIDLIKLRMQSENPMHMILQGDVSSGKSTILEFMAVAAMENGFQAAVVAPTDILAKQLFERVYEDTKKLSQPVVVEFLGGKTPAKLKTSIKHRLAAGQINIIIGTHAILQDTVIFDNLGAVVIDEQHKFGTKQRTALLESNKDGTTPDLLIMSATPIPRTMASVIYGDMDITILDELPAGRLPIETVLTTDEDLAWEKIEEQVAQGHQAYVVTSLVEESETIDAKSAEETVKHLESKLPNIKIGLMHGKLKGNQKQEVMDAFMRNEINVLVSTTVIEVGVNVPNATVIAILNAERFGLASLHQIRGRVGRSDLQSTCFLIGEPNSAEGEERLQALVDSNDGFYIAEQDLKIRKEGSLFGVKQSGDTDLRLANIHEHRDLIEKAKADVPEVIKSKQFVLEVKEIYKNMSIDS